MATTTAAVSQNIFQRFLNSPAGPKTIHFWAPASKWALVIAGIGDLARPAEKLSVYQNTSLAVTGVIWTRYSMVIIPKNWTLFSVNIFLAATGVTQLARIFAYHQTEEYKQKVAAEHVETVAALA